MPRFGLLLGGLWSLLLFGGAPVAAQDTTAASDTARAGHEAAWNQIVTRNGLEFSYVFYQKADNENDGVVLRLRNRNDHPVRYRFTIIFRGPKAEAEEQVRGFIEAQTFKTGENDGLFWVPFDKKRIGEVGLRGVSVRRLRSTR